MDGVPHTPHPPLGDHVNDVYPPDKSWILETQLEDGSWGALFPSKNKDLVYARLERFQEQYPDRPYRVVRETTRYTIDDTIDLDPVVEHPIENQTAGTDKK